MSIHLLFAPRRPKRHLSESCFIDGHLGAYACTPPPPPHLQQPSFALRLVFCSSCMQHSYVRLRTQAQSNKGGCIQCSTQCIQCSTVQACCLNGPPVTILLQGCMHDRANSNGGQGYFPFSYGYQEPSYSWRTIMVRISCDTCCIARHRFPDLHNIPHYPPSPSFSCQSWRGYSEIADAAVSCPASVPQWLLHVHALSSRKAMFCGLDKHGNEFSQNVWCCMAIRNLVVLVPCAYSVICRRTTAQRRTVPA